MPKKVTLKNGKSFTYLTPEEKCEKYKEELKLGFKCSYKKNKDSYYCGLHITNKSPNGPLVELTPDQRKYREDYIKAFNSVNQLNNSFGSQHLIRDYSKLNK